MANPEDKLTGEVSGRYLVSHEIGKGGTALVYEASDQQTGGKVAIKILRPELAPSIVAKRFLSEVRLTTQLTHPNIIQVLDSGEHEGRPYVVFPLMSGGTLRRKLKLKPQSQLPVDEAVALARTVALALGHAHREGYIHRDVKPENILMEGDVPYLADFGIARAMERSLRETTTSTDVVRGTVPYMSPEQATAEKELDGRTDIYSLACVLYEMLGGEPPFTGPTTQAIIARHLHEPPRSLRVVRPKVSAPLQHVIERALAKNAADRYQTADEFAEALRNPPPVPVDPVARGRRRKALLVGSVAGIAAATAAFVAISKIREGPAPDPTRVAVLYFDAAPSDSSLVAVARGITRDVIASLPTSDLTVISAPGVERFTPTESPAVVSRELDGAGTIVYGSVEPSGKGDSMRVSVRLVDATSKVLGNFFVESPRARPLVLRDEVVRKVAEQLRVHLGKTVALKEWQAGTASATAWTLRQRAEDLRERAKDMVAALAAPQALASYVAADSFLVLSARADTAWAEPLIARGWEMLSRALLSPPPARARLIDSASALAERAARLTAQSAQALELRGTLRYRKWQIVLNRTGSALRDSAESDLHRATMADGRHARAWSTYSMMLQERDRAAAADAARRAINADPYLRDVAPSYNRLIFAHLDAERYDSARALCASATRRFSADPVIRQCELNVLGWSGRGSRDVERAARALRLDEENPVLPLVGGLQPASRFLYAAVLARSGDADSARAVIAATRSALHTAGQHRSYFVNEAHAWATLGASDTAVALLTAFVRAVPSERERIARHPWFRALTREPRFVALVAPH